MPFARRAGDGSQPSAPGRGDGATPGRGTLSERLPAASEPATVHAAAERGVAAAATPLPFRDTIQRAFGRHDVSGIRAHVGGAAEASTRDMGAKAYALGDHVVLDANPDLFTVAHEAAHVVQQRAGVHLPGGVGVVGDRHEQHADQVAGLVVSGKSAEHVLDQYGPADGAPVRAAGVQGRFLAPVTKKLLLRDDKALGDLLNAFIQSSEFVELMVAYDLEPRDAFAAFDKISTSTRHDLDLVDDGTGLNNATNRGGLRALLASLVQRRVERAAETTVERDRVTPFTDERRDRLGAEHGKSHQVEQYGLRVAKNNTPEERQLDLRIHHEYSTKYLRDSEDQEKSKLFTRLLQKHGAVLEQGGIAADMASKVNHELFMINSPFVIEKLGVLLGDQRDRLFTHWGTAKIVRITDGIFAVAFPNLTTAPKSSKDSGGADGFKGFWDAGEAPAHTLLSFLNSLGATPSSYQALKALDGEVPAGAHDPSINNLELLGALRHRRGFQVMLGVATNPSHPLAVIYHSATAMIDGLGDLAKSPRADVLKHNTLVASALRSIGNLCNVLAAARDNASRATRFYDLLIDELNLILMTVKPYAVADFQAVATGILTARVPSLAASAELIQETHLAASGMDALSTAWAVGVQTHAKPSDPRTGALAMADDSESANYFEVPTVLGHGEMVSERGATVIATLNPSTPRKPSDLQAIVDMVLHKLADERAFPQVTLVIDSTIEKDAGKDSQLEFLFTALMAPLVAGRLSIMLAKSYQKYASLGTGKVMAGSVIVVNNPKANAEHNQFGAANRRMRGIDEGAGAMGLEENQLMIHMLKYAHQDELGMLNHAADNARFLQEVWPNTPVDGPHVEGLPFVVKSPRATGVPRTDPSDRSKSQMTSVAMPEVMDQLGLENRDSFSFQNTSYLEIMGPIRINAGHESHARIVERFAASGMHMDRPKNVNLPAITGAIGAETKKHGGTLAGVNAAVLADQRERDESPPAARAKDAPTDDQFANNRIASQLAFATSLFSLSDKDTETLVAQIQDFQRAGMAGVSAEMQAKLASDAVRLILQCSDGYIATKLAALPALAHAVPRSRRVDLFTTTLRDRTAWSLSPERRTQLGGCLLGRIGLENGGALAQLLVAKGDVHKASLVIDAVGGRLKAKRTVQRDAGLLATDITKPAPPGSREEIERTLREVAVGLPAKQAAAAAPWDKEARELSEAEARRAALYGPAVAQFGEICAAHENDADETTLGPALWGWITVNKAAFAELKAMDAGKFSALFQLVLAVKPMYLKAEGIFLKSVSGKLIAALKQRNVPPPEGAAPIGDRPDGPVPGDPSRASASPDIQSPAVPPKAPSGREPVGAPVAAVGPIVSTEPFSDRMLHAPAVAFALTAWVKEYSLVSRLIEGLGARRIREEIRPERLGRIVEAALELAIDVETIIGMATHDRRHFELLLQLCTTKAALLRELRGRAVRIDPSDQAAVVDPADAFVESYLRDLPFSNAYLSVAEGEALARDWHVEARVYNQLRAPTGEARLYRDRETGQWYRAGAATRSDGHCLIHGLSLILHGRNASVPDDVRAARLVIQRRIDREAVRQQCADLIRSRLEGAPQAGIGYWMHQAMSDDLSIGEAVTALAKQRAQSSGGRNTSSPAPKPPAKLSPALGPEELAIGSITFNTTYGAGEATRGILLFVNGNHYIQLVPIDPPAQALGASAKDDKPPPSAGSKDDKPPPSAAGMDGSSAPGLGLGESAVVRQPAPPIELGMKIRFRAPVGISVLEVSALAQNRGLDFYIRERNPGYPGSGPEFFAAAPSYADYGVTWCLDDAPLPGF